MRRARAGRLPRLPGSMAPASISFPSSPCPRGMGNHQASQQATGSGPISQLLSSLTDLGNQHARGPSCPHLAASRWPCPNMMPLCVAFSHIRWPQPGPPPDPRVLVLCTSFPRHVSMVLKLSWHFNIMRLMFLFVCFPRCLFSLEFDPNVTK